MIVSRHITRKHLYGIKKCFLLPRLNLQERWQKYLIDKNKGIAYVYFYVQKLNNHFLNANSIMEKIPHPDISTIDFADDNLSAFFSDGRGYVPVTPDIIDRITHGTLVITEYHKDTPLGNVIYLSPVSFLN